MGGLSLPLGACVTAVGCSSGHEPDARELSQASFGAVLALDPNIHTKLL